MARRQKGASGSRRLVLGLGLLGLAVLLCLAASRFLILAGSPDATDILWRILGVKTDPSTPPGDASTGAGAGTLPPSGSLADPSGGTGGAPSEPVPAAGETGDRITAGAKIVWTTHYELCGCAESDVRPADAGLVGLDRPALAVELRDWDIIAFSPTRIELSRSELDTMCARHSRRTLLLESDCLLLYAGSLRDPGVRLLPLQPMTVAVDDLTPSEAAILKAGLSFDSEVEVVRYLEGLGD